MSPRGRLVFNADGTWSFNPNGAFEALRPGETEHVAFTYHAVDDGGTVIGGQDRHHHRQRRQRCPDRRGRWTGHGRGHRSHCRGTGRHRCRRDDRAICPRRRCRQGHAHLPAERHLQLRSERRVRGSGCRRKRDGLVHVPRRRQQRRLLGDEDRHHLRRRCQRRAGDHLGQHLRGRRERDGDRQHHRDRFRRHAGLLDCRRRRRGAFLDQRRDGRSGVQGDRRTSRNPATQTATIPTRCW